MFRNRLKTKEIKESFFLRNSLKQSVDEGEYMIYKTWISYIKEERGFSYGNYKYKIKVR